MPAKDVAHRTAKLDVAFSHIRQRRQLLGVLRCVLVRRDECVRFPRAISEKSALQDEAGGGPWGWTAGQRRAAPRASCFRCCVAASGSTWHAIDWLEITKRKYLSGSRSEPRMVNYKRGAIIQLWLFQARMRSCGAPILFITTARTAGHRGAHECCASPRTKSLNIARLLSTATHEESLIWAGVSL